MSNQVEIFKNRSANIDSFSVVDNLLDDIINNSYIPILFIEIENVIFDYCNEKILIDNEIKKVILKIVSIDINRIVFLTKRSSENNMLTNKQLNNLKLIENKVQYNILSYDGNYNYRDMINNTINKFLYENQNLLLNPKTWALFIGNDSSLFPSLSCIFNERNISSTLFMYLRNYISLFSYIPLIKTKHYEILENEDKETNNILSV